MTDPDPPARRALAAAALAFALAGCASPAPAPVLLTLPPSVPVVVAMPASTTAPAAAQSAAPLPLLAVRRVGIPEYLSARRVRFRADDSTLGEWPNTFWAERIEIGVSREFASALREQLPQWRLCDDSCGEQAPVLALRVDLAPLDFIRATQRLQARARITVTPSSRAAQTLERAYDLPARADSPQAQAEAVSTLLGQVAEVAAAMVRGAPR